MKRTASRALQALKASVEQQATVQEQLLLTEVALHSGELYSDSDLTVDDLDHIGRNDVETYVSDVLYGLESLQERLLSDLKANRQYDQHATGMLTEAIKSTYTPYGLSNWAKPALESIEQGHDTKTILVSSLEGTSDTLKRLWEAIKATLVSWKKKFEQVLERVVRSVEPIKREAHALTERASRFAKTLVSGTTIKVVGAGILHYGGKVDGVSVLDGVNKFNNVYIESLDKTYEASQVYYSKVEELAEKLLYAQSAEETSFRIFETFNEVKDAFTYQSDEFSGGWSFGPVETRTELGSDVGYTLTRDAVAGRVFETTVPTPTPDTIRRLGIAITSIANNIMAGRARLRALSRDHDDCIRLVDAMIRKLSGGNTEPMAAQTSATRIARLANRSISAPVQRMTSMAYFLARAAIAYGNLSMNTLEDASQASE